MKKARIAELKNNLSRYLQHVRGGESVLILDRNTPVARLVRCSRRRREADEPTNFWPVSSGRGWYAGTPDGRPRGWEGVVHRSCAAACSRTS